MFPDSHRTVLTLLSWLNVLGVVLAFWISILKIFKYLPNYWHRVTDIANFERRGKFFGSYSELLSKFGGISFQEYIPGGISHLFFYGDLVYKLRRVLCEANFVSLGSKIVIRFRCRKYEQVIIERTIVLLLGPSSALYRSFLEHCSLAKRRWGLYDGTCLNPLRWDKAVILVPSYC